ncbi:MAG: hypothetical protein WCT37_03025 [Patescibacteria group bacterium]|jgi:archaellum component FlaC
MVKKVTTNEILEAVNEFSNKMDNELGAIKSDIGTLKSDVGTLKSDVGTLKSDVGTLKSDVNTLKSDVDHIKAKMVTKDYLDDKLANLKGELVIAIKSEDAKVNHLANRLRQEKSLSGTATEEIIAWKPFAKRI